MNPVLRRILLGVIGIAAWLATWQWATTAGPLARVVGLPDAITTLRTAAGLGADAAFWGAVGATSATALVALVVALVIGVALGVLTGLSTVMFTVFDPILQFLRPLPPVVLLPLVLLLMGPSPQLAVFLSAFAATWPILIQVQAGVMAADPVALDTARAMSLPWWRIQLNVVVPGALPFIATGVRIAAAASLMLSVGAGILAGTPGIGRLIVVAQETGQVPMVFAIILWSGVLGLVFAIGLGGVERALVRNNAREANA